MNKDKINKVNDNSVSASRERPKFKPEDLPEPTLDIRILEHPMFSGKVIRVKEKWCNDNPRMPGGKGWKAFNLLLANDGEMTYEEYRKYGGRNDHLEWDLAQHYNRNGINDERYIEIIDKHSNIVDQMTIKEEILRLVDKKLNDKDSYNNNDEKNRIMAIREIMQDKGFYLEKGREAYNQYMNYPADKEELQQALDKIGKVSKPEKNEKIQKILFDKEYSFNNEDEFKKLLMTLIVYLDKGGTDISILNEYSPHRSVTQTPTQQSDRYTNLVKYKLGMSAEIKADTLINILDYIKDPSENISILNSEDRTKIALNVFGKKCEYSELVKQIQEMFSSYKDMLENQENYTIFCSRWFYDVPEIKKLWIS